MTVAIASFAECVQTSDGFFVSPTNWKSFTLWIYLFKQVRIIMRGVRCDKLPESWVKIPEEVGVFLLESVGKRLFSRYFEVSRKAMEYLDGVELLYARMPGHEIYWIFCEACKRNIPLLLELHGDWETATSCTDREGAFLRRNTRYLRALWARRATFKMADYAFAAVTIGPVLAEKYVREDKPVLVSTNHTIDEQQYFRRDNFELNSVLSLLFVGELADRKGLDYLFRSLDEIAKMGRKFEMVMIGSGPKKLQLEEFSRQKGFSEFVKFMGRVTFGDVLLECYRKADVFILPSVGGEGVPRVIHEAMSQGCPVIATDVGSTKWQLENESGIVIPPGDVKALTENLIKLLDDRELRKKLSLNGFNRSKEFTFEKQKEKIAKFVRENVDSELLK